MAKVYNKYSHEDTEILIEVSPKYVEIWDTSDDGYAFHSLSILRRGRLK